MAVFRRERIAVPDARKGQIVFKWPDLNIRRFTKAIVAPDEIAVFMYQGKVAGTLPPGQHSVDATELPFLGTFVDMATGGNQYRVELYFISTREFPDLRFGGRIDDVQDPQTGLVVALRVFGEYSMRVVDAPSLLLRLTGTVDVTNNAAITDWVTQQLLKVLRTDVVTNVVRNGWPILGLAQYVPDMERSVIELSNTELQTYGLVVARMGNFTVSLSDEDEETLKGLAKDTAYSRLAGSFQQYAAGELQLGAGQGMAKGGGATGGAFLATGVGVGAGALQQQPPQPPPPPAPGFSGGGPGFSPAAGAQATVECPKCQTQNAATARFCSACGTALAPPVRHCSDCGVEVPAGARFCPACGHPVEEAAAAPAAETTPAAGAAPAAPAAGEQPPTEPKAPPEQQ
jgi:membrane protease subunit (stomatin/prohibitin family)